MKEALNLYFSKNHIIVATETNDNQIDFSSLIVKNVGKQDFTFQFNQYREVVPRDARLDPITKFSYVINEDNVFYGLALRSSGHVDIYWNMTLIDTTPDYGTLLLCLILPIRNGV